MKIYKPLYFINFLIFLSFFCFYSYSSPTFIDIDTFEFPEENRTGIRVISFDREAQKYTYIGYLDYTFSSGKGNIDEEWVTWAVEPEQPPTLWISSRGNILIEDNFNNSQYYLRTYANIFNRQNIFQGIRTNFNGLNKAILTPQLSPKDGDNLKNFFEYFSSDIRVPPFVCISGFNVEKRIFSEIVKAGEESNTNQRERAKLGELCTELTMLSFGYTPLQSKNNSDQGFDGVWVDLGSNPNYLFLTESKCQDIKKSASLYMDEDLCDEEIERKLREKTPPQTKSIIEIFINEKPDRIFKLLQRLKPNGKIQSCIKKFDLYSYQLSTTFKTIGSHSSNEEKKLAINTLAIRMNLSPQDMIKLILESMNSEWRTTPKNSAEQLIAVSNTPSSSSTLSNVVTSFGQLALTPFPSANPVQISSMQSVSTPTALIQTPVFQYIPLQQVPVLSPTHSFLQSFSYPSLIVLIKLLNNPEGRLPHSLVSLDKLGLYAGFESNSNIKKVLKGNAPFNTAQIIWLNLTTKLEQICLEFKIVKDNLLATCAADLNSQRW